MAKRSLWASLVWELDGSMNLSQLIFLILSLVGAFLTVWVVVTHASLLVQIVAFTWLTGASLAVLIGALPIAKAKILSESKLPVDAMNIVGKLAEEIESSTDIQELTAKQKTEQG